MMPIQLYITLCVLSLSQGITGFNISRLMSLYIDACGEKHMCYDWPNLTYYPSHPTLSRCPPCFCDDSCFQNLNCCPDKFFQRPLAVLDSPHLFIAEYERNKDKIYLLNYEIISTCIAESPKEEDIKKCEDKKSSFHFERPITSLATNLTYRNIFCALCSGKENDDDLIAWDIAMKKTAVNFIYFIESNKQFQTFAKMFQTSVIFTPPPVFKGIVISHEVRIDRDFTDPCTDDRDLQIACSSSYHNSFRLYQNIFCYMCMMNSIGKSYSLKDTCTNPSNLITQKCLQRPKSSMAYPYKNFYCFKCNVPLQNKVNYSEDYCNGEKCSYGYDYHFIELAFNTTERFNGLYYLKFHNMNFDRGYLLRFIRETPTTSHNVEKVDNKIWKGLLKSFSTLNPNHICSPDILPEGLQSERQCECSYSCLFVGKCTCCVDTAIMYRIECIDVNMQSSGLERNGGSMKFAAISNCFGKHEMKFSTEYEKIRHLCETNPSHYDILIFSDKVTYKNIFCFLCNTNFTIENDALKHVYYEALEFTIVCNNQLRFLYALNLGQILEMAKAQGCRVIYDTTKSILCEAEDTTFESQCPDMSTDNPVKWLCENTSSNSFVSIDRYRNEFCRICNLNETKKNPSNICVKTDGGTCLNITNQSINSPLPCVNCAQVEAQLLYRNLTVNDCKPLKGSRIYFPSSLMRDLFSPSRIIKGWFPSERTFQNTGDFCYPGKILEKGRCVPIISHPNNIVYSLFVSVQLSITSKTNGTTQLLLLVKDSVHHEINEILSHPRKVLLKDFYFFPKTPILEDSKNDMFYYSLNARLYFQISYYDYFNREEIERNLLQLPFTLSLSGVGTNGTNISYYSKGMRFSNLSHMLLSNDSIFREEMTKFRLFKNDILSHSPPSVVYVSPLLLCRQKRMLQSEVIIDLINFRIISKKTKEIFYIGDFVFDLELAFRVCSYGNQFPIDLVDMRNVLETTTTILNIISILSMAALLVLYMTVPGLRTLPGLNIMSTTFSLLCMQITYTIANVMEKSTLSCTITGILLHYFWLSLCCCLFSCSLHMCKSFSGQGGYMQRHTNIRTIFRRYVIICYTTPILIIGTNIIITYLMQNKIGYGNTLCFVEDFVQNVLTFTAPLLITCVVNIVMFTITAINIRHVKHIQKSKEDKPEVVIFLKLFSLTGTVWIFQILDGILNVSVFSLVVIILTSAQGTFIFLSFACSSRILNYLKSKTGNKGVISDEKKSIDKGSSTSQQNDTKISTLHNSSIAI